MLARVSFVLAIAISAAHTAAPQGIASPVFGGAGQTDESFYSAITADPEGNIYFAGGEFTGGSGDWLDFDPGPGVVPLNGAATQPMFFVAKVDPERNLEWLKSVPVIVSNRFLDDICVDAQGNVIVVGYVSSTQTIDFGEPGNPHPVSIPEPSRIIWKLDADGTTLWVRRLGPGAILEEVHTAADGSVYVLFGLNGTADFDPGPGIVELTSNDGLYNGMAPVLLKLTANGIFAWAKLFPETDNSVSDSLHSFAIGTDGRLYLALRFRRQIDADPGPGIQRFFTNPISDRDTLLVCLNASGNLQWATQDGRDSLRQLELDGAGGLLLQGADLATRYSLGGALLWTRTIGGISSTFERFAVGDDNDFYVIGLVLGFGADIGTSPSDMSNFTLPQGNTGVYVARWDLGGTQLWCTMLGSTDEILGTVSEIFATEGRLLVTTDFGTQVDFDPSSTSQYFMTPYASVTTDDTAFITLAGNDELWVDFDLTTPRPMDGSQAYPLRTLDNAIRAIQPGQTITIKSTGAGVESPATGTFSKAMTLRAVGGTARIGVQP